MARRRLIFVPLLLLSGPAVAQDIEPGTYLNVPVGANALLVGGGRTSGEVVFDPTLPVEDAEADINSVTVGYVRGLDVGGRSARLELLVPYTWGSAEGLFAGDFTRITRSGFADVHLDVPDLPGGQLTVASPHLENRAEPKDRRRQLEEVFEQVRAIQHPVVIAGDLNTTGGNGEAFKLERELYNKYTTADTYVNSAIQTATGLGLAYDVLRIGFRFSNNVSDPTVRGIRFFASNKEHGLFDAVEDFRFDDGTVFDFRGERERTVNDRDGTLANSNQRAVKGFAHTYTFVISGGVIGKYKLDWMFVKSRLRDPRDEDGPRALAPHFPRTMNDVNRALGHALSDHNPMSVDLPFEEPPDGG